jgi:hypothetical protein
MADTYGPWGILLSSFFDGNTGMQLQAAGAPGKDALLLGAFLTANEWANMIGLYELSLSKIARKLPVLEGRPLVMRAFELLDQARFAHYDEETEFVWVREMARVRLRIIPGHVITNPKQLTGAQNCYQRLPLNPFLGPFYDRYNLELALKHRRHAKGDPSPTDRQSNGNRTPIEGQSIGDRSAIDSQFGSPQTPLQVPVPGTSTQGSVLNEQRTQKQPAAISNDVAAVDAPVTEEQPALPRRNPSPPGKHFRTLCSVSSEVLAKQANEIEDLGDYTERVKQLAARRQVDYSDRELLRSATDAALFAYRRKHPTFLQSPQPTATDTATAGEAADATRNVPRGGIASLGELVNTFKSGSVDELTAKVRAMAERRRA